MLGIVSVEPVEESPEVTRQLIERPPPQLDAHPRLSRQLLVSTKVTGEHLARLGTETVPRHGQRGIARDLVEETELLEQRFFFLRPSWEAEHPSTVDLKGPEVAPLREESGLRTLGLGELLADTLLSQGAIDRQLSSSICAAHGSTGGFCANTRV